MNSIILAIIAGVVYLIAYNTYGRFLGRKIFELNEKIQTPAHSLRDDIDYVPTKRSVLFSHHFTSIAGTGPIVGPAIAIIWGWVPAFIWVLIGPIFMGAVHDFGALVLSMRNHGKSIGELSRALISPRVRILFLLIIFFELLIVIAIFALVIAMLFEMFPQAVFPVWIQIPIAVVLGYAVYKWNKNINVATFIAVATMYLSVIIGSYAPMKLPVIGAVTPVTLWIIILFIYAFVASVLPVWKLLQPRDYINGYQLLLVMGLLFLGIIFVHPTIIAPKFQPNPIGAPPMLPFLFVTIACGAISGFHSLVSSGTSSKQISNEKHSLFIGYGSMLTEGFLAVIVLIAVAGGIGLFYQTGNGTILTGKAAWIFHYESWSSAGGLGAKVGAFVQGAANILFYLGVPRVVGVALIGVFIASFAGTTLDTATRIQRYIINELAYDTHIRPLQGKYGATLLAVVSAGLLAFSQGAGKGGLILWPLFGCINQLLAGLGLLVLTVFLKKKGKPFFISLIPMIFMLGVTGWAMVYNLTNFLFTGKFYLVAIGGCVLILEIWMLIEAGIVLQRKTS